MCKRIRTGHAPGYITTNNNCQVQSRPSVRRAFYPTTVRDRGTSTAVSNILCSVQSILCRGRRDPPPVCYLDWTFHWGLRVGCTGRRHGWQCRGPFQHAHSYLDCRALEWRLDRRPVLRPCVRSLHQRSARLEMVCGTRRVQHGQMLTLLFCSQGSIIAPPSSLR